MKRTRVVALSGGVGGAKLALGLSKVVAGSDLCIVVNTGDDFEHLDLHISPDLDSVLYAMADRDDPVRGWGRRDESWAFMGALADLGSETWFQLGDKDLAIHIERTRRLRRGESLTDVTGHLRRQLGIDAEILPMTNDRVRTIVHTAEGQLDFQVYFVRERCAPTVTGFTYEGAADARAAPKALAALVGDDLRAIIICPSNPFLSVAPLLAIPEYKDALRAASAPVIAISPLVGGKALKGPAAKIMKELGLVPDSLAIADFYEGLIDGIVVDEMDRNADLRHAFPVPVVYCNTIMKNCSDKEQLSRDILTFADELHE